MPHSSRPHRPIPACRDLVLCLSFLLMLALGSGCYSFRPLTIDSPRAEGGPTAPGGQGDPAQAASAAQQPPDVKAGQDDLAQKVREYTERLEKQRAASGAPPAGKPLKQPGTGGQFGASKFSTSADKGGPGSHSGIAPGRVIEPGAQPRPGEPEPGVTSNPPLASDRPAQPSGAAAAAAGGLGAEPGSGPPVVLASSPVPGMLASDLIDPARPAGGADAPARPTPDSPAASASHPPAAGDIHANISVGEAAQPAGPARPVVGGLTDRTLADAIATAEKMAAGQPADFRIQLQLRMVYLAAGRTRDAQAPWAGGAAGERRMLAAWVEAAVALGNSPAGAAAGDPHDAALDAVDRLRMQLAEQAPLKIRTIKLASRVDGFGVVAPFDGDSYRAGQWVIVYCELENLVSRLDPDSRYRTELSLRLEILTAEGKSILRQEDAQVVDRSLNQRRDFFLARRLRMPGELTGGHYVLRVSIEDKQAGKVGESMLKFQVR